MSALTLHHNGLSSCSQKVRLVLAEKGLAYESREVNLVAGEQHAPEYVKLNPNHVVPTLVHDGRAFVESSLIDEYLDEVFPDPPLAPADAAGRHAMRVWVKRIDEQLQPAAGVVTYAIGARPAALAQPAEVRAANLAAIPDPAAVLPYVLRLEHLAMAPLFSDGVRPRVADWLARVKARPSFDAAITAWAPAPILALFRAQGEAAWPAVEPLARAS
ncbi:MAG: hypothetical protein DCC71_00075 [Proteobacteria bacterium]|nr:MAG: hypothetical protein DCC71_00075 [Pseudomonadota bacterium]